MFEEAIRYGKQIAENFAHLPITDRLEQIEEHMVSEGDWTGTEILAATQAHEIASGVL